MQKKKVYPLNQKAQSYAKARLLEPSPVWAQLSRSIGEKSATKDAPNMPPKKLDGDKTSQDFPKNNYPLIMSSMMLAGAMID